MRHGHAYIYTHTLANPSPDSIDTRTGIRPLDPPPALPLTAQPPPAAFSFASTTSSGWAPPSNASTLTSPRASSGWGERAAAAMNDLALPCVRVFAFYSFIPKKNTKSGVSTQQSSQQAQQPTSPSSSSSIQQPPTGAEALQALNSLLQDTRTRQHHRPPTAPGHTSQHVRALP